MEQISGGQVNKKPTPKNIGGKGIGAIDEMLNGKNYDAVAEDIE